MIRSIVPMWMIAAMVVVMSASAVGPATALAAGTTVKTGQAMVNGRKETVLTDSQGMTLYYDSHDTAHKVTCTGGCAKYWPPLLLASGSPTGPADIQGGLTTFDGPLGRQVEFRGHPLYLFVRDKKPGQATGEGLANHRWHVATPGTMAAGSGG